MASGHDIALNSLCILLTILATRCSAHEDGAYMRSPDDAFNDRPDWMNSLRDDVKISELALPGTHDSATWNNDKLIDITTTQCLDFKRQFYVGVRFFDIRIRHIDNGFALHHGVVYLNLNFGDFLNSMTQCLRDHPSEVVLFRLREEYEPTGNSRGILDTLRSYLDNNDYKEFYHYTTTLTLTLQSCRGKFILLLDNFSDIDQFGVSYNGCDIQDKFNLVTNWDLYAKWEAIKAQLDKASDGDPNTCYINFFSGSGGSFPYFVASGHSNSASDASRLSTGLTTPGFASYYPDFPRLSCFIGICTISFEGTNILGKDKITQMNSANKPRTIGICPIDFGGDELFLKIIENNAKYRK